MPSSIGVARRLVSLALSDAGLRGLIDNAALLTSELVTNAIVHGVVGNRTTEVTLRLRSAGGGIRVEVFDTSPALPVVRRAGPASPSGRGMYLIDRLASRWGVSPDGAGKWVWFELGPPRAAP